MSLPLNFPCMFLIQKTHCISLPSSEEPLWVVTKDHFKSFQLGTFALTLALLRNRFKDHSIKKKHDRSQSYFPSKFLQKEGSAWYRLIADSSCFNERAVYLNERDWSEITFEEKSKKKSNPACLFPTSEHETTILQNLNGHLRVARSFPP